ncbi:hypothetical protein [Persephonella sp.]|uniref:hypothetical protein n=1 Tax=Persephonella sp. TaxID=2060922 RepID=UPI0026160A02|nr:hypothetical protein [Persephonella sp.]
MASSCATKQEPKVVYKYIQKPVYVECEKPVIPEKPKFQSYEIFRVKFEGKYYYCADVENAKIISENWLRYKNWCESLETLLKNP